MGGDECHPNCPDSFLFTCKNSKPPSSHAGNLGFATDTILPLFVFYYLKFLFVSFYVKIDLYFVFFKFRLDNT